MTSHQEKNKKDKKGSFFLEKLNSLTALIYSAFINSFIGRAICGLPIKAESGAIGRLLDRTYYSDGNNGGRRIFGKISGTLENGLAASLLRSAFHKIVTAPVSVYGLFFVVYGILSILIYFFGVFVTENNVNGTSGIWVGSMCILCAFPFLLTPRRSLVDILRSSRGARRLMLDFFCVPEEKLDKSIRETSPVAMLLSALSGMIFGIGTYFFHPSYFVIIFFVLLLFILVMSTPEAGVVLSLIALPIIQYVSFSAHIVILILSVTLLSYVVKVLKGRRVFNISPTGVMVVLFALSVIVSGSFAETGRKTFFESILMALVMAGGYFLVSNLMRSDKKLNICIKILTVSICLLSFIGIWSFMYNGVIDGIVYKIGGSIRDAVGMITLAIADSAAVFGMFAAMVSPLLISRCFEKKYVLGVVATVICFCMVVCCSAICGTYEALVAMLIGVFLYFVLYSHKTMTAAVILILPIVGFVLIYPYISARFGIDSVREIVKSYLPALDEVSSIRSEVRDGIMAMMSDGHMTGIGAGNYAFETVFSQYATSAAQGAKTPESLYTHVFCISGIFGALIFIAFVVMLLTSAFRYCIYARDKKRRAKVLALTCGFISALLLGIVSCIWSDCRMLYLFWVYAGLINSALQEGKDTERRENTMWSKMK